jgi:hypothetical protein
MTEENAPGSEYVKFPDNDKPDAYEFVHIVTMLWSVTIDGVWISN